MVGLVVETQYEEEGAVQAMDIGEKRVRATTPLVGENKGNTTTGKSVTLLTNR